MPTRNGPRLIEMIALWCSEAGKYNVSHSIVMCIGHPRPQITADRETCVYCPNTQVVPENVAVILLNGAHTIIADVDLYAPECAEGAKQN